MNRIVGLETEYGCLAQDPLGPTQTVARVRNWMFEKHRFGLPDIHQRDWDEPAGNGGFLFNGGRAYVDMGHLEYCTPECRSLADLVGYDRAGDAILLQALRELRMADQVGFVRNNIDHYSGATFGCHENYLVRRVAPLTETNVLSLLGFLTLRLLYTGAGRVGSTAGSELRGESLLPGADATYQISQRADYINNELFEWVQFNRAIINTRDEPLADPRRFRRLHLLHGDTNVLPASLALKVGTTSLALDLLEINAIPKVFLADSVQTFHVLSHQPDGPWRVSLAHGGKADAVELLSRYHEAGVAEFLGRDAETDHLLSVWGETLSALSTNPESLIGRVDWITKRWLLQQFVERERLSWDDPWLKAQDLEYHHVEPQRGLGWQLARTPSEWETSDERLAEIMRVAPRDTRAHARSHVMRILKGQPLRYSLDWEVIELEGAAPLHLIDPFEPEPSEVEAWRRATGLEPEDEVNRKPGSAK
jgi:proteasome accessory factor A